MFGTKLFFGGLLMLAVAMVICGQEPGNRSPTSARPIVRNEQGQVLSGLFDRSFPGVAKIIASENSRATVARKHNCRTRITAESKTSASTGEKVATGPGVGVRKNIECGNGSQCVGPCMVARWDPCGEDCGGGLYPWYYADCYQAMVTDRYRLTSEGACTAVDGSGMCNCLESSC